MKHVNFKPWVGKDYATGGMLGQKVLILGESHYCLDSNEGKCSGCTKENLRNDCHSQTIDVIRYFLDSYANESYLQTFVCFERAVLGKVLTSIERKNFWNSVVFYNYLQVVQKGPRRNDVDSQTWRNSSEEAFHEILEEYIPDRIIIWGIRNYNNTPNWDGKESIIKLPSGEETVVWTYTIQGKEIPMMRIYHPSTPQGKSWLYWHQFHKIFLSLTEQ